MLDIVLGVWKGPILREIIFLTSFERLFCNFTDDATLYTWSANVNCISRLERDTTKPISWIEMKKR